MTTSTMASDRSCRTGSLKGMQRRLNGNPTLHNKRGERQRQHWALRDADNQPVATGTDSDKLLHAFGGDSHSRSVAVATRLANKARTGHHEGDTNNERLFNKGFEKDERVVFLFDTGVSKKTTPMTSSSTD